MKCAMKDIILREAAAELDIDALLRRITDIRVGVLGDFCLDIYWHADMRKSELSRETPHFPLPVVSESFSLGGAANVCANAAALGAKSVTALGVIGGDWRGEILKQCCKRQGIAVGGLVQEAGRFTNAYCKPLRHGISDVVYEDPRLDFCSYEPIAEETEAQLLESLSRLDVDVLCVSDQLKHGCVTEKIRGEIMKLSRAGMLVIVDSRDRIGLYRDVVLKPNEVEGYFAVNGALPPSVMAKEEYNSCARKLAKHAHSRVYMTLGGDGCVYADDTELTHVTAAKSPKKIDFVGAGDTVLSSLGVALAANASPARAMIFANLCASVTIGKIGVTGTASPEEIKKALKKQ